MDVQGRLIRQRGDLHSGQFTRQFVEAAAPLRARRLRALVTPSTQLQMRVMRRLCCPRRPFGQGAGKQRGGSVCLSEFMGEPFLQGCQ